MHDLHDCTNLMSFIFISVWVNLLLKQQEHQQKLTNNKYIYQIIMLWNVKGVVHVNLRIISNLQVMYLHIINTNNDIRQLLEQPQ